MPGIVFVMCLILYFFESTIVLAGNPMVSFVSINKVPFYVLWVYPIIFLVYRSTLIDWVSRQSSVVEYVIWNAKLAGEFS